MLALNRLDSIWFTKFMWFISRLSTVLGWIFLTLVYLAIRKDIGSTLIMLVASGLGVCFSVILKQIIKRPRPWVTIPALQERCRRPYDPSFPSGHTFSAFTIAATMAILDPPTALIFMGFAGLIGLSRVYLLVHHISDVVMGALLGTLLAQGYLGALSMMGLLSSH